MQFEPDLTWVNVPDPANPPAGAKMIGASDLLRYEQALAQAKSELALLNGQGQRGYVMDQSVGRVVKVWDYQNSREQLVYGDTGWRNVSSLLVNGWTGTVRIRRVGDLVYLRVYALNGVNATSATFMNGITGFRDVLSKFTLPSGVGIDIGSSYALSAPIGSVTSTSRYEQAIWPTFDTTWPTTLPGVAV